MRFDYLLVHKYVKLTQVLFYLHSYIELWKKILFRIHYNIIAHVFYYLNFQSYRYSSKYSRAARPALCDRVYEIFIFIYTFLGKTTCAKHIWLAYRYIVYYKYFPGHIMRWLQLQYTYTYTAVRCIWM